MRIDPSHPIDLSQPISHQGPAWADYDPPSIAHEYTRAVDGFNAETVRMNTHTGTHVDVPFHFDDAGDTVDRRPLETFGAPAVFVDLRERVEAGQPILRRHLEPDLRRIRHGDFAVLVTGWGERRDRTDHYLKCWPHLSGEGAEALVERGAAGVGIDALSIGGWGGPEKGEPSHLALLGAGMLIIEELRIPDAVVNGARFYLTAFPVLLEGCGGSWTRAVAWPLEEDPGPGER
jgi:kynurenine formamidase